VVILKVTCGKTGTRRKNEGCGRSQRGNRTPLSAGTLVGLYVAASVYVKWRAIDLKGLWMNGLWGFPQRERKRTTKTSRIKSVPPARKRPSVKTKSGRTGPVADLAVNWWGGPNCKSNQIIETSNCKGETGSSSSRSQTFLSQSFYLGSFFKIGAQDSRF